MSDERNPPVKRGPDMPDLTEDEDSNCENGRGVENPGISGSLENQSMVVFVRPAKKMKVSKEISEASSATSGFESASNSGKNISSENVKYSDLFGDEISSSSSNNSDTDSADLNDLDNISDSIFSEMGFLAELDNISEHNEEFDPFCEALTNKGEPADGNDANIHNPIIGEADSPSTEQCSCDLEVRVAENSDHGNGAGNEVNFSSVAGTEPPNSGSSRRESELEVDETLSEKCFTLLTFIFYIIVTIFTTLFFAFVVLKAILTKIMHT